MVACWVEGEAGDPLHSGKELLHQLLLDQIVHFNVGLGLCEQATDVYSTLVAECIIMVIVEDTCTERLSGSTIKSYKLKDAGREGCAGVYFHLHSPPQRSKALTGERRRFELCPLVA